MALGRRLAQPPGLLGPGLAGFVFISFQKKKAREIAKKGEGLK
jgi:hypothetical protein